MTDLSQSAIAATAHRIAPFVRETPVVRSRFSGIAEPVTFKLELLQHSGSFKARGAFANLTATKEIPKGVAAASGGNHGAAAAYAARELGIPARIFVPEISSPAKVARIASYGAEVVQKGANYQEALALCEDFLAESGWMSIHAYNSELTLQGQATLALELERQAPEMDSLLVAVGGGGLIAGIAGYYAGRCKVVSVEPQTCDTLDAARKAGAPVAIRPSGVATDSLGASQIGALAFPITQQHVAECVLVNDASIREAQRELWRSMQLVCEPGGATAFAALLTGAYKPGAGERVGVVLCGGNTELQTFAGLFRN
jgi:threonine dehydratase